MVKKEASKAKKQSDNHLGLASLILGIMSITMISGLGAIPGLIGLVFGYKQRKIDDNKWAKWGYWLSMIGFVLSVIFFIYTVMIVRESLAQLQ